MPAFHLWFQESPELALDSPPDPIALLVPTLYNVLAVRKYVRIGPCAFIDDQFRDCLRLLILLGLCALDGAPESLRTAMSVLAKGTRAYRQTRGMLHSLQLFFTCKKTWLRNIVT